MNASVLQLLAVCVSLCSVGTIKEICDNGEYEVESDFGADDGICVGGKTFPPKVLYIPAGSGVCTNSTEQFDAPHSQCMQTPLSYPEHPPSHGPYRPLAPRYGEYSYLPPQRWLHTIKTGGVAFLYHPCANTEQVQELRALARSCLHMFVITPYSYLTKQQPFAVVTWGCVFRMGWVRHAEVKAWLVGRGIHYGMEEQESGISYQKGLQNPVDTQAFTSLCQDIEDLPSPAENTSVDNASSPFPQHESTPPPSDSTHTSPCPSTSHDNSSCARTLHQHQTGLMVLLILLGVVLLGFFLLLVYKVQASWRKQRYKNQRYKSVSKYFPFSYEKQGTDVVIPEVGLPKKMSAERQVLLNESDEDEL